MGKIARYLNQLTIGNVFDTPDVIEAYSTDRSVLRIKPKFVALPESTEDIRKLMRFCYQLMAKGIRIPVTVRGSGMDEMGADLGNGLVISMEKLNRLMESDKRERLVRVQAGITLKELNTALSLNGMTIPVGGHDNDTIGGLIASCPTDDFAGKYGGIMRYVERMEVVLANGDIIQTDKFRKSSASKKGRERSLEGSIYNKLPQIIEKNKELINKIRTENHGSCGYPAIVLVKNKNAYDLLPLFFGSEGTLGIITEVILRAVPIVRQTARAVGTFEDFKSAQKFLDLANSLKPREVELYDIRIIRAAQESGKRLSEITKNMKTGFVVFARFDRKCKKCLRRMGSIRKSMPKGSQLILESSKNSIALNEFENSLISFLNQARSSERVPLMTDFYLPADNLEHFLNDLSILEKSLKMELALFGSYSAANYNLRPKFNVGDRDFAKQALTFLRTGAFVVSRQGGAITGGSPEGRIKAIVSNPAMTDEEKKLYSDIKNLFDRYNILNPDVKLGADAGFTMRHFRDNAGKISL
ncbi:FAD-binding oxidoreductase [Candidatus Saccharibacteria bacterium]|nr:FAD-binding oxidoreductase [Candidatus Saccharibacteria bacterium]